MQPRHVVLCALALCLVGAGLAVGLAGCGADGSPVPPSAAAPGESAEEARARTARLDSLLAPYGGLAAPPPAVPRAEAEAWADSVLATLSLDQRIGQMLVVDLQIKWLRGARSLVQVAEEWGVGGFHVPRRMPPREILRSTNLLHERAAVPLFFSADYEWGPGQVGTPLTELPAAMAFGAAADPGLAEAAGALTAIEARALGINVLFAPVADVNNNPRNPIINTRSFGDDPLEVGRLAAAFVRGAQRHGVFATLKHFPGHGNTGTDTHIAFDAVAGEWPDLSETELEPYRAALDAEPGFVMSAHLWMRALDDAPTPATFSSRAMVDVLRDSLGFEGLVTTDAVHMGALTSRWDFETRILQPVLAGADIVLNTYDPRGAIRVLREAVADGRLDSARVDESARRVLVHKAMLGLHRQRAGDPERLETLLAEPRGERVAEAVARESVTLVEPGPLPLAPGQRVALVQLSNFDASRAEQRLTADLREGGLDLVPLAPTLGAAQAVRGADAVVIGVHLRVTPGESPTLSIPQMNVINSVLASGPPAVLVLFGNPYATLELNSVPGLVVAYDGIPRTASAVADVLLGRAEAPGRLPIELPGRYRRGRGLTTTAAAPAAVFPAAP